MSLAGWCCSVRHPSHRPSAGTAPSWLLHRLGLGRDTRGRHTESLLGTRGGNGAKVPSLSAFLLHLDPNNTSASSCSGDPWLALRLPLSSPSMHPPYSNTLAPCSRQVRFGRVHTLPLLRPRAARKAHPQRQSLSWSLLRYLTQVLSVLVFFGTCM